MKFQPLSRTLVIRVLLASSLITSIMTGISFYLDYRAEMNQLDTMYKQIEDTSLEAISLALWDYDDEALATNAKGLKNMPSVNNVKIINEKGETLLEIEDDNKTVDFLFTKEYLLYSSEKKDPIGSLIVEGTLLKIYQELVRKGTVFFITQGIKTIITSFILLFIFKYYVTNHLESFANQLGSNKHNRKHIKLGKSNQQSRNELDILVAEYNELIDAVRTKEQKQMEEIEFHKAKSLNSARLASLGEMATSIAHEINNPLAIIEGNAHLILRKSIATFGEESGPSSQALRVIETSERISKIIRNLKAYSRDGSHDAHSHEPIDGIIKDAVELCQARFEFSGRDFRFTQEHQGMVQCRKTELVQSIVNLLNNAFDATEDIEDASIEIRSDVNEAKGTISIKVVDSGPGIPEDIKARIFDPFFTTKDIGKGTGLGLSISKTIIEQHSGQLMHEITEDGLNCFTIELHNVSTHKDVKKAS